LGFAATISEGKKIEGKLGGEKKGERVLERRFKQEV